MGRISKDEVMPIATKVVDAWKIGNHWPMIALIPVILLFSYTRSYKDNKVDLAIPVGGVVLAVLVGLEGIHQGICMNLPILTSKVAEVATSLLK